MPPKGSPAGAGYKTAFGAAHGFDPYAGRGFIPNFVGPAIFSQRAAKINQQQFGIKGATGLRDPSTGQKSLSTTGKTVTPNKKKGNISGGWTFGDK